MKPFNLHNSKIKSGFTTPDGYFDAVEKKLMAHIPTKKTKVFSLTQSKAWFSGIAAALAVFFFVSKDFEDTNFDTVDTTTLEQYLAGEFSTYDISDKLESEDLDNLNELATINTASLEDYFETNTNIEYYLSE